MVWTNEIIGKITKTASNETGLAEGTIVTSGTIDAAAEAISVGVIGTGDMMMIYKGMNYLKKRFPRLHYVRFKSEEERSKMNIEISKELGIEPIEY